MKKILVLLLLISTPVMADIGTEKYIWLDKKGDTKVTYYLGGTDSVMDVLEKNGFGGVKVVQVQDSDPILKESPENIKFVGNKPAVDKEKKDAGKNGS